ncbi:MAG: GntR family transcriptional regulator [Deltaproteobacteria bacterium]|jgi:GntR family transcriptional regulator|nr:GntR family transcriptional regulator [Deltaproteobacteria bacterium]MBT4526052.1 GntR family transcriptional regulator [Deltaproteobacteria bacterium]
MEIVNTSSSIPKYIQIGEWLKELIKTGRFKEGEKLPSEIELSKMCQVNRNTLRQAISELVIQGFLKKDKGVGTFVLSQSGIELKHDTKKISSFKDDFGNQKIVEHTKVIKTSLISANRDIAKALVIGIRQKVIVIKRLRIGNDIPLIYEENYLPYNVFKGILGYDLTQSLYKIITEHYQLSLNRSRQEIRAINLNATTSGYFMLPEHAAGFFMKNITFDQNSVPIDLMYSYFRGDKYCLELDLEGY